MASVVPFVIAIVKSFRAPVTEGADPWEANSLEWATSSPPPEHNFDWLPPIRAERPVFDLRWINHDEVGNPDVAEAWVDREGIADNWRPLAAELAGDPPTTTEGDQP